MKSKLVVTAAAALVALAGCGREEASGELTAEEQRQLDEAARMLDDNMIDVSPDSLVANEAELDAEAPAEPSPNAD